MPRPPTSPSPPPPASFPFTAGTFDYPQASPLPQGADHSREERPTSRAHRSRSRQPERPVSSARHDTLTPRISARLTPHPSRRAALQRRLNQTRNSETSDSLLRTQTTATANRPRATPSERYLRRSEARIRQERAGMESAADFLDTFSDLPLSNPFTLTSPDLRPRSPTRRARSPTNDAGGDQRSTKRRKIDHKSSPVSEFDGFRYGYKGQVVAGRLKMQIVSCDGGEYCEQDNPALYNVHNVLKNDKSVYCSESSRCNLLLSHIGDTPFSLEKVVIRAPDRGFTAPIQEGLIFVSMSANELLSSTASYDLHYTSSSRQQSPSPSSQPENEHLSLQEALDDPYIWQYSQQDAEEEVRDRIENRIENLRLRSARWNRETSQHTGHERPRTRRRSPPSYDEDLNGDNCDNNGEGSYMSQTRVSAPTPPPFTVTTASEEEDSDSSNEDQPSAAIMADRLRRESRWRADSDDDDDDRSLRFGGIRRAPRFDFTTYVEWRERRERHIQPLRAARVSTPSRIEPTGAVDQTDSITAPHARFFIKKNKSKITIKFHPAISGKNVLLKLWSPTQDGNIDIESVQFYGYSGPRFFPATNPC